MGSGHATGERRKNSAFLHEMNPHIEQLIALHASLLVENPYAYFELAYTRQSEWMAWITSKPREDDPNRKVIACGQGSTPDEAAKDALENYNTRPK